MKKQFGTFQGVFTPSLLTILGVIMYLRFGWVLGNVGLVSTLIIVTLSTAITFMTGLSVSALATNMKVKGGGAYFIISRSLGLEVGASIGIWLFFAQALGISFYIAGFLETIPSHLVQGEFGLYLALLTLTGLTVSIFISSGFALKIQVFILFLILFSLISFFCGGGSYIPGDVIGGSEKEPFWKVFSVFFPAVTGILSGISMSGDLKNPSKSLPLGTLGAVVFCYIIYMVIPLFLWKEVQSMDVLISNTFIMKDVARWKWGIIMGVWGATLSSALGSLLSAPRTLQALAKDGVLPKILGRESLKRKEPRIALIFTFVIAGVGIFLGDLNIIAPVLSMFFLMTYGLLNVAATFESLLGLPSWRPKFKVYWPISALGAISCFGVMFMINSGATIVSLVITIVTYYMLKHRSLKSHWGDARYGIYNLLIEYSLRKLESRTLDEKNWTPKLLVFSGSPKNRWHLVELADSFLHGKGILTVVTLLKEEMKSFKKIEELSRSIKTYLVSRGIQAFVEVIVEKDLFLGMRSFIGYYGIGAIRPNTVMLGLSQKKDRNSGFIQLIREVALQKKNIVIINHAKDWFQGEECKDITLWWNRKSQNAGFALALGYLLSTSPRWKGTPLNLKTILSKDENKEVALRVLEQFIQKSRFQAEAEAFSLKEHDDWLSLIKRESKGLVVLGLRSIKEDESIEEYGSYFWSFVDRLEGMPPFALILASEEINFKNIFKGL